MNGIEKITEKILEDVKAYEKVSLEQAEKEKSEILDAYKSEADFVRANVISRAKGEAEDIAARTQSSAAMIKRNALLQMKSELIEEAFCQAQTRIAAMDENAYIGVLSSLILKAAPPEGGEVLLSKNDRRKIGVKLIDAVNAKSEGKKFTLSESEAGISGGFILKCGNVETNCSVSSLVDSVKLSIEHKVAEILFRNIK